MTQNEQAPIITVSGWIMRKIPPDILDFPLFPRCVTCDTSCEAITIAREIMLQLFIDCEHQQAKGAEQVWRELITARNGALVRDN